MKRATEQVETTPLEDFLHVVFRRKTLIIGLLAIAAAIYIYGSLTEVVNYKAEAIVMIRRLPLGYQMPAESRSVLKRGEVVNSELEIITSPAVAEWVVDELGLDEGKNRSNVIYNLSRKIKAEAEPESNIIRISYSDPKKKTAAEIANAALDGYLDVRAKVALDHEAVNHLERQAERIKAQMDSLSAEIVRYGAEEGQLLIARKAVNHMGLITGFRSTLIEKEAEILALEPTIARTREWLDSGKDISHAPSPETYKMATVRHAKLMLVEVRLQLAEARAKYAPEHPAVKRLEQQEAGAEQVVRTEIEQALLRIELRLEDLKAERDANQKVIDELNAENVTISEDDMQIRLLEHELEIRMDLYAVVQDRREQFAITAATDPSLLNVGVVSRAAVPVVPARARVNMKVVFAFFTLLFGGAIVLAIDRMDQSLVRRVDVEREVGLRVLASVQARRRR